MRVLVDVSIQQRAEPTGVERAQATLLDALLAEPAGPTLVLATPGRLPARWREHPRVVPAEDDGAGLLGWRDTVLPAWRRRERTVLLHSPVAALPRRPCGPALATIHEVPWAGRDHGLGDRRLGHRLALSFASRVARCLLCPSSRTAADVLRCHPAAHGKVVVVPHGIAPRFQAGAPGPLPPGVPAQGPVLLAVGSSRAKKNLLPLLEAVALLAAGGPSVAGPPPVLVVAGPGGDQQAVLAARAARADLAGRVVFAGFVPEETLLTLYRRSQAVVHPSLFEGFGLPVLEALACGVPVVASRQGAVGEAGAEAVLLVDGRDARALARALAATLAGGPDVARRRAAGLAFARRASAAAQARAVVALWESLLGAHR